MLESVRSGRKITTFPNLPDDNLVEIVVEMARLRGRQQPLGEKQLKDLADGVQIAQIWSLVEAAHVIGVAGFIASSAMLKRSARCSRFYELGGFGIDHILARLDQGPLAPRHFAQLLASRLQDVTLTAIELAATERAAVEIRFVGHIEAADHILGFGHIDRSERLAASDVIQNFATEQHAQDQPASKSRLIELLKMRQA